VDAATRVLLELLMTAGDIPDVDLFQRPEWMARGACRDAPTDLVFLERGASSRAGKALCAACVVRLDCLDCAMADP
jgi:hypothetical protein